MVWVKYSLFSTWTLSEVQELHLPYRKRLSSPKYPNMGHLWLLCYIGMITMVLGRYLEFAYLDL